MRSRGGAATARAGVLALILCGWPVHLQGQDDGRGDYDSAFGHLRTAATQADERKILEAMVEMIAAGPTRAVRDSIALLPKVEDLACYYGILTALGEIWTKEGLATIGSGIRSKGTPNELRRDLMIAIQLNEYAAADELVLELVKDVELPEEIRLAAVDECAKRKTKEAVPVLIESLKQAEGKRGSKSRSPEGKGAADQGRKPTRLERTIRLALEALTAKALKDADAYEGWWKANGATFSAHTDPKQDGVLSKLAGTTVVQFEGLKAFSKDQVAVVSGGPREVEFIERVLGNVKVAFTLTDWRKPTEKELSRAKILIVNCDAGWGTRFYPDDLERPTPQTKKINDQIRKLVENGTYLVTTDWGLRDVMVPTLGEMFKPIKIEQTVQSKAIKEGWFDRAYRVWPPKGSATRPLLRGVFVENGSSSRRRGPVSNEELSAAILRKKINVQWRIDGGDCFIEGASSGKGEVLVVSPELKVAWGHDVVGFVCPHGKGKALNFIAHFKDQMDGASDRYALQKLLLNYLIEARENATD